MPQKAVRARLLPPECRTSLWQGRCEAFEARLLPNVGFLKALEKLLESAQNAAKASGEGAARQLKPGYCPQNAATACGKGAARHLKPRYCLTLLSEGTRKALGKHPDCRKRQLEPGYCPQNAATACGKGAARHLKPGYCLTLLSEGTRGTRKALGKRPECCKSLRRRRREAVEARLLPPECSNSLWQGRSEAFEARLLPNVAF